MDCTLSDASRLVLEVNKALLKFRVGDLNDVDITSAVAGKEEEVPPCSEWKGHHVKVTYRPVTGKDFVGDLLSIQFL